MESETCPLCFGERRASLSWRFWRLRITLFDPTPCWNCSGTGRIPTPDKREDQDADRT